MNRSASDIFRLEHEIITKCGISKERFRKVSGSQWENIYQKIAEKYADKTKTWKNGLHWANTNGCSPKSMKKLLGCYAVDYSTWFLFLPQIIKEENKMVYFLIDKSSDWYCGEEFWIFESYVSELVKALDLLNHTAFLGNGWLDYYVVSKKYQWIIGFNHHDIVSCIGEGINLDCFKNHEVSASWTLPPEPCGHLSMHTALHMPSTNKISLFHVSHGGTPGILPAFSCDSSA